MHQKIIVMERPSWVLPRVLGEMFGYTEKAISEKRKKGQLIEGVHYKMAPDGKYVYHWRRYEDWLTGTKN